VKLKTVVLSTGYEPSVVNSPSWGDLQGAYFFSGSRPFSLPNAATKQMGAALQKYEHRAPSDFPTYDVYQEWIGADLMIKGLGLAGKNPTSSGVIKALRGVTAYNANGLLPTSLDYATNFGHDQKRTASGSCRRRGRDSCSPASSRSAGAIFRVLRLDRDRKRTRCG
jgi:hypothetical protein